MDFSKEINFAKRAGIISTSRLHRFSDAVVCVYWLWRLLTLTFSRGPEGSTNLALIQVVSTSQIHEY